MLSKLKPLKSTLLGLALVATIMRLNLFESLWLDEATSIVNARDLSFLEILTKFSPGDFHPPLYYLVLKVWIGILGSGEVSARSLSLAFGVGTVIVLYLFLKRIYNPKVAEVAALLLALNPLHFYYSSEARMYSMEAFLGLLVVWNFVEIYKGKKVQTYKWVTLVISSILLIYTDYLPLVLFPTCVALILTDPDRKGLELQKKKWGLAVFSIILLSLPMIPLFINQLQTGLLAKQNAPLWWDALGGVNIKQLLLVPVKFMIGRISFDNKYIYASYVAINVIVFGRILYSAIRNWKHSFLPHIWFFLPLIYIAVLGLFLSVFSYFRLLFLLPAFCALLAVGLFTMKSKWTETWFWAVVTLSCASILIYIYNPNLHREDWRSAVNYVEENSKENAASVFVSNNQRDPYMYYSDSIPSGGPGILDSNPPNKIWFFRYVQPIFDPEEKTKAKIEQLGYTKLKEHDFNGIVVWEYERKNANLN